MKITRKLIAMVLVLMVSITSFIFPAAAADGIAYGIGYVNTADLRLRSEPNTTSAVLDTAYDNDCVLVTAKIGDWYQVCYNLQQGYMHQSYLDVSTRENAELGYGTVSGSGVNLRTGPDTTYPVSAVANSGSKCYIIGLNNGWYKVIYNNQICYIRSDFVTLTEFPYENRESPNSPKFFRRGISIGVSPSAASLDSSAASAAPNVTGSQILAQAQQYLGCPYASGGSSPNGFDCSGFVYYVLKQIGMAPGRTPASQFSQGVPVEKNNLQVGDIVFFSSNSGVSITHVGIYSGNGQFIHAPNSRSVVSYSDLTKGYWANTYCGARRVA